VLAGKPINLVATYGRLNPSCLSRGSANNDASHACRISEPGSIGYRAEGAHLQTDDKKCQILNEKEAELGTDLGIFSEKAFVVTIIRSASHITNGALAKPGHRGSNSCKKLQTIMIVE